jgi:spectinomycin phosphotransferase
VPLFLHSQGITAVIAPLESKYGEPWTALGEFKVIISPYIEGKDGYEVALSEQEWLVFGASLRSIHSTQVPPELARLIPYETYAPKGRAIVRSFQAQVAQRSYPDPAAARMAEVLLARQWEIEDFVRRADQLGQDLRASPPTHVLCHSDIHPGNLLIHEPRGLNRDEAAQKSVYIVDWDTPLFAPPERDLMLIGGCSTWADPRMEALFYQGYAGDPGYAQKGIDRTALAYYRLERVIQDIAEFCQQILGSDEGDENREQSLAWFMSIFDPGHEFEIALSTDDRARDNRSL